MTTRAKLPLLTYESIRAYLLSRPLHVQFTRLRDIPLPSKLTGINEACELILAVMEQKKRITVIGDYDVDGVVASAIMQDFFTQINYPIEVIIPNRFKDGYGLSAKLIERIESDLIITVDNGITAHEAARICKDRGIQLIITDHHTPSSELPEAKVIINPKLPYCSFPQKEICGANVAWYLCGALKIRLNASLDLNHFLDILTLAIIADVMPLVEINRLLVRQGLKALSKSKRMAIVALRERLQKSSFDSESIGFLLAPLLNSAGRMEDASLAFEFLLSPSLERAHELLEHLYTLNNARKEIETQIFHEALEQINADDKLIFVYKEGWHEGILGIVASRLCEHFHRPAFVLGAKDGVLKGSGRSAMGVNLVALLHRQGGLLLRYGGHKSAVGIELYEGDAHNLISALCNDMERFIEVHHEQDSTCIGELAFDEINERLLELLEDFEPYGEGNPRLKFFSQNIGILQCKQVGRGRNHTAFVLQSGKTKCNAIAFSQVYQCANGERVSCIYHLARDPFKKNAPQLVIERLIRGE